MAGLIEERMAKIDDLGPEARAAFREQMDEARRRVEQRERMVDSMPSYDDMPDWLEPCKWLDQVEGLKRNDFAD